MRKILMGAICFLLCTGIVHAQSRTVTGKVTDNTGTPIPNASVIVKNFSTGTKTSSDGTFSISVPTNAKQLIISSVGMEDVTVNIGTKSFYDVTLRQSEKVLSEVVVTSLGIARDKRSLGYATQNIKADQIADKGEVNVVNALQGKVSGVSITNASGSAGASVNINIRGITSFTGNNQPLFIVDGIPISNDVDRTNGGPLGTLGDNQPANRALDLDINNIESINILKGPTAAALYGSRASSGAIIITTKKGGSARNKAEIIVNSSYSIQGAIGLPKLQNDYGQGTNGIYSTNVSLNSWGPKFGSTPSVANGLLVNGNPVDYRAYPNNINDFFQKGAIFDNSVTVNGGDLKQNYILSASNLNQKGILPNTELKRTSIKFGGNTMIRDKISFGGSVNFINTIQKGILGGNGNSSLGIIAQIPRSLDLTSYKTKGTYQNPDGTNNWIIAGQDNPYYDAYKNPLTSNVYRFLGNVTTGMDVTKWLNVSYRLGLDAYTDRRKQIFAVSSGRVPNGQVLENTIFRSELNGDLIITGKKNNIFTKDLNLTAILGQNINERYFQSTQVQGDNLAFPGFYNVSNATTLTVGSFEANTKTRLVGFYGQMSWAYKNYLFLEVTGRADQSSTLPKDKNTYFYPSASLGFVFTDAFKINSSILSYGKIRASSAKVGKDAPPYLLDNTYASWAFGNNVASFTFPFGSTAGFGASTRIAPKILSPEFTTSNEVGVNLGLFKNRVSIDFAYFKQVSKDQIINVAIPVSTGYSTKTTNIGEMTNKGIEALVNVGVISTRTFRWDVSANYTRIRNKVVSIAPGVDNFGIPGSAFTGSIPSIKVGYPYGVILGGVIPRSNDGQRLINPATGGYQPLIANQVLADPNNDYKIGFTNNLKYKSFSFGFTFDFNKGGQVLSFTSALYKSRGMLDKTGVDRDKPHILPGVIEVTPGKYIDNNIQVAAQTYWQALGGLQSEFNVYDATVFRLREISASYDVPSDVIKKLKINGARFSVFARNVFYVAPNSLIDPEVNTQGAGNIRGLELQSAPNARTVGVSLKLSL
ncbi:MAG: SusC/RagA family TonB-linked outer membrane protein [Sphingobacteriales bacterium]|nr:MAG: SusC/RagA family TonB-linked outer membrane protein [Sphingobacteriales bacterium]